MKCNLKIFCLLFLSSVLFSQEIIIHKIDATVWGIDQVIKGELIDFSSDIGVIFINGLSTEFELTNQKDFAVPIKIDEGENTILIEVLNGNDPIYSDTLRLTLGYKIRHELYAYSTVENSNLILHGNVLSNPDSSILLFEWTSDPDNPVQMNFANPNDSVTSATFNSSKENGEYYFNLKMITEKDDTIRARTYITVKNDEIIPFDIYVDHAAWIDSAIIYEITPYNFVNPRGNFNQVKKKIPDFVRLGVNTLWIQPIYKTNYGGQGYDVTNYFKVRDDYGTEKELRELIKEAKDNNLRIIFDFVANHSSIEHPYARQAAVHGENSHYYNYYQRETDNTSYSQHYSFYNGFINYFWDQLPNLNFNNPEVEKWIGEAIRYWVEEFDIDGYRFDAVWGVNARKPQFMKDVRFALKRFKPEVMMLAEDKATWQETFDKNFDVAFDWAPNEDWVSQWTWQTNYSESGNQTIFNYASENSRQRLLRNAITNNGNGYSPNAKVLRFMGNNDIPHFITHHGLERTKMAAILLFTLPGVPMIYNGQEIGVEGHPYNTEFLFYPGYSIDYSDLHNLFPFYQRIIEIRKTYKALSSDNYQELLTDNENYTFAFRRWEGSQNLITAMNMKSTSTNFTFSLPIEDLELDTTKDYFLTDLINGEVISGKLKELHSISVSIDKFCSKIFLLADSAVVVTDVDDLVKYNNIPNNFELAQNYPNPFNPTTTISYKLPVSGRIEIKIFDVLGKEVRDLLNQNQPPGNYSIEFRSDGLASGIYFCMAQFLDSIITKKMIVIK